MSSSSKRWTPFDCLAEAEVTESGLLKKYDTEVELLVLLGGGGASTTSNSYSYSSSYSSSSANDGIVELRAVISNEPLIPLLTLPDGTVQHDTTKVNADWYDRTTTNVSLTITSHRIVFFQTDNQSTVTTNKKQGSSTRIARYIHLSSIFTFEADPATTTAAAASFSVLFKSPKITLHTAIGDLYIVFIKKNPNCTKNRDEAIKQLQLAIRRRIWENDDKISTTKTNTTTGQQSQQQQQQQQTNTMSSQRRKVGVDAIVTNVTKRNEQAAKLTESAFTGDIEVLLQEATELVKVIHKYIATLDDTSNDNKKDSSNNGTDNSTTTDAADTQRFLTMLSDMGMASSLLRKSDYKGREDTYYIELARMIADFLRPKLRSVKSSGVITVTDAYCMYNRARGTNLLSPDEFNTAIDKLSTSTLSVGITVSTFPDTGLKVMLDESIINDTTLTQRFLDMITTSSQGNSSSTSSVTTFGYITALDVSHKYNIPTFLAIEQLKQVERIGTLVRDETLESIRFYKNLYF